MKEQLPESSGCCKLRKYFFLFIYWNYYFDF